MTLVIQDKHCDFSADRVYRYTLWRVWQPAWGLVQFIGLNPSTADETNDDPTIRRCTGFAKAWNFGGMCMTNLFAFRATDPRVMKAASDPVGPDNDRWLVEVAAACRLRVAAWGAHGTYENRSAEVLGLFAWQLRELTALAFTAAGEPRHPLYLRGDLTPALWRSETCQIVARFIRL